MRRCHFSQPNSRKLSLNYKHSAGVSLWLDARLPTKGILFVRRNWICGQVVSVVSNNKKERIIDRTVR